MLFSNQFQIFNYNYLLDENFTNFRRILNKFEKVSVRLLGNQVLNSSFGDIAQNHISLPFPHMEKLLRAINVLTNLSYMGVSLSAEHKTYKSYF